MFSQVPAGSLPARSPGRDCSHHPNRLLQHLHAARGRVAWHACQGSVCAALLRELQPLPPPVAPFPDLNSPANPATRHEAAVPVWRLQDVAARALGLLGKPLDAGHAARRRAGRQKGGPSSSEGSAAATDACMGRTRCPAATLPSCIPTTSHGHLPPTSSPSPALHAHPLSNSPRDSASGLPLSRVMRRVMSSRAPTTASYQLQEGEAWHSGGVKGGGGGGGGGEWWLGDGQLRWCAW